MEIRSYRLSKGEVLLVKGPASIMAESEGLSVLGASIKPEEKIIVRKSKVLPIETDEDESFIRVTLGEGGESQISHDRIGTKIWDDVKEKAFNNIGLGKRRLIIIGETDSGKSTLTSYLVNIALMKGLKVIIIDGDIGQGDLAPPGCIGAAIVRNKIYDLRDLRADIFGFLGFTSPRYVRDLIIKRLKKIISYIEKEEHDLCIINTDGYVADEGMDYKLDMVQELRPDIIICFKETDKELFKRLKDFDNVAIMISADKPEGIVKSLSERSERRLSQYFRFLKDGRDLSIGLGRIKLSFMGDFYENNSSNIELKEISHRLSSNILFAKRADNKIIVFRSDINDVIEIFGRFTIFNQSSLKGMFIGLGSNDDVFGFAQINKLHQNQIITLNTNFKGNFDTLFLSNIRISPNLRTEAILPIVKKS
ncbi:MAG: Clp1/GlmU family protein [Nitrososphaerales archaeon]